MSSPSPTLEVPGSNSPSAVQQQATESPPSSLTPAAAAGPKSPTEDRNSANATQPSPTNSAGGAAPRGTITQQQQQNQPQRQNSKSTTSRTSDFRSRSSKLGVPAHGASTTSTTSVSGGGGTGGGGHGGGSGHHHRRKLHHHGSGHGRASAQDSMIPEKPPKIRIPAWSVVPIPDIGVYTNHIFGFLKLKETGVEPRKLVARSALISDFTQYGYISDFFSIREVILQYRFATAKDNNNNNKNCEMLIYYDPKVGQDAKNAGIKEISDFYLVTHEATKEFLMTRNLHELPFGVIDFSWQSVGILRQAKANRKWESLGSHHEIIDYEQMKARQAEFQSKIVMLDFTQRFQQLQQGTGVNYRAQTTDWKASGGLADKKHNLLVNVHVDADEAIPEPVPIKIIDACTQTNNSTLQRTHVLTETDTIQKQMISVLIQASHDPLTAAERDKIIVRDDFFDFLSKSVDKLGPIIKQNSLADYYYDEWEELPEEEDLLGKSDTGELKEILALIDLSTRREDLVSHIDMHLGLPDIVFASLAFPGTYDERAKRYKQIMLQENFLTVFSCWDPIRPILHMYSPDEVQSFAINPSNPFIIAGGCANGQLVIWDLRSHQARLLPNTTAAGNGQQQSSQKSSHSAKSPQQPQQRQPAVAAQPTDNNDEHQQSQANRDKPPVIEYSVISDIDKSHKMAITDVIWLSPTLEIDDRGNQYENEDAFSYQIVTASADSTIAVWDIRPTHAQQILPQLSRKGARQFAPNENLDELVDSLKGLSGLSRQMKPFVQIQFKLDTKRPAPFTKINLLDALSYIRIKQNMPPEDVPSADETAEQQAAKNPATDADNNNKPTINHAPPPPQSGNKTLIMNNNPLQRVALSRRGRQWHTRRNENEAANNFWFGTEYGEIAYARFAPKYNEDGSAQIPSLPIFTAALHDGPITSIERSPFARDTILVTGGYTFTIWRDGRPEPIMQSAVRTRRLNAGLWSSTRPAVFYIAKQDGSVEVWDLLDKSDECVRVQSIASVPITCLSWVAYGDRKHVLACADHSGATHLVEVPRVYRVPVSNERQKIQVFFDRELDRQQWSKSNLERIRVQMAKEKAEEAAASAAAAAAAAQQHVGGGAGDATQTPTDAATPVATSASPAAPATPAAPPKKPAATMALNEMLDNLFVDDEVMTTFCNKLWTNFESEQREWEQQLGLPSSAEVKTGEEGGTAGSGDSKMSLTEDDRIESKPPLKSKMSVQLPAIGGRKKSLAAASAAAGSRNKSKASILPSLPSALDRAISMSLQEKQQMLDIIPDIMHDPDLPKRVESLTDMPNDNEFGRMSGDLPALTPHKT